MKTIQAMPESDYTAALPVVQKMEIDEENAPRLLAAAITLLKNSDSLKGNQSFDQKSGSFRQQGFNDNRSQNFRLVSQKSKGI